jgi:hypothetical protein
MKKCVVEEDEPITSKRKPYSVRIRYMPKDCYAYEQGARYGVDIIVQMS